MQQSALDRRDVIGDQDAIQMIIFMLDDARRHSRKAFFHQLPLFIELFNFNTDWPFYLLSNTWN